MAMDVNMIIRPADDLQMRVEGAQFVISVGGTTLPMADFTFAVLNTFRAPLTFGEGTKKLQATTTGIHQWMMITAEIVRLLDEGALVSDAPRRARQAIESAPTNQEIKLHINLLRDVVRTEAYLEALRQVVQPDDVVVDIGTGNGILAMGALQAGARHVYAIEAGLMAKTTREIFAANDFADRTTLIEGWSLRLDVPEKADVLVSEILSNDVFTENALQATRDGVRRFLKPGGRVLPTHARMYIWLVNMPEYMLANRSVRPADTEDWQTRYGLDFAPLYDNQWSGRPFLEVYPPQLPDWQLLSEAVLVADVRLDQIEALTYELETVAHCTKSGHVNGMLGYFDLEIAPGVSITTNPFAEIRANSWANSVWLATPTDVVEGDSFRIRLKHENRIPLTVEIFAERIETGS